MLERGSEALGRMLDDSVERFSAAEIIKAFKKGQTKDLLAKAEKSQKISALYEQFQELSSSQSSSRHR